MSLSVILIPAAVGIMMAASEVSKEKIDQGEYYKVNTSMKDEEILKEALENRGGSTILEEMQMEVSIGDVDIIFQREENDTISAFFHRELEQSIAEEYIEHTEIEYKRIVQQQTYEKLLQRAKSEGLILQSEQVNEEDTIVLTFNVEE